MSILGLITIVFIVAALKMGPDWAGTAKGLLPSRPSHDKAHYWYLAVSIIGATISPYLFNFYSSGAVEDEWDEEELGPNRATAIFGMGFGGLISVGVLMAATLVLHPRGIEVSRYEQVALIVTEPLGMTGYWLFGAGLFIACLGAALELSLDSGYSYAQVFGWNWGENEKPADAPRFSVTFSIFVLSASVPIACGVDPLKLTLFSMAITVVVLPLVVPPFLVLMNDEHYAGKHTNGLVSNVVVFVVIVMAGILALVAIPLEMVGGQ